MQRRSPKEIRDQHSSYQRVYFAEEIKQRIAFFLSDKLFGKNLDIGGGRYSYYPNSTVIDLSPVALEYNPAKEKIEFDLESLHTGKKLPFSDHSFDHATMVSVFQYIKHQKEVIDELIRVLKPGAELYILNCNGGEDECIKNSYHTPSIQKFFEKQGFPTLIENIPFHSEIKEFQSVCIAMPDRDLFGEIKGKIRNKEAREVKNAAYSRYKPFTLHTYDEDDTTIREDLFTQAYLQRELRRINQLFCKIAKYPVTTLSKTYRENIERFTQECLQETNNVPLITSSIYNAIEIDMLKNTDNIFLNLHMVGKDFKSTQGKEISDKEKEGGMERASKFGLQVSNYSGHFPGHSPEEILKFYQDKKEDCGPLYRSKLSKEVILAEHEEISLITFLAEIPLNSCTKTLQESLYPIAKYLCEDIDKLIFKHKAKAYYRMLRAHKQKRKGEELLKTKKLCTQGKIETVERKEIDYIPIIQEFPKLLDTDDREAFKSSQMPLDY